MRFFIALEIPQTSKEQLYLVQEKIQQLIPEARLTDNDKLHLTLAFIGEQPDQLQHDLVRVIKEAASGMTPFSVTPAYFDGFPSLHHPHTLWVGVKGDVDKLVLIRERIKDGLAGLEFLVDERRFIPHIALAKLSNLSIEPDLEEKLEQIFQTPLEPIKINSIKLFESTPDGGFHKHNTLAEVRLISPRIKNSPFR